MSAEQNTLQHFVRWQLRIAVILVIAIVGFIAVRWWLRTSTPPQRELAKTHPSTATLPDGDNGSAKAGGESSVELDETGKKRSHKFTNHLKSETSPYLLQHAHNPVNWYPWGPEALAKAKREDKPIFLSVGYSTCYWCHVMEKQSFEAEDVAEILNKHFVAIKVDREERPDIDEQYMLATQLVTGRGGWPNSVWLTPDGRPWMAGTYFPKEQFMRILNTLSSYWNERRQEAEQRADRIAQAIQSAGESSARISTGNLDAVADQELVTEAITNYRRAFDKGHGGFSTRPKFPPHGALRVLTYEYQRTGNRSILPMITRTLDAMWMGGMHDHIGGGFHRYSTDSVWLLPHFEKMLYDNAQLMRAYTDAYVLIGTPRYRAAVDDIFRWVEREMTSPEGAFYSAIDSGEVGKEGEVYVWHYKEILEVLGDKDGKLFAEVYNIGKHGNFREEATGEASGTNIVHLKQPLEELANAHAQSPDAFKLRMAALREKLLARRNTWVQPHKDDKILTSWNGLMIGALAHAGARLNEPTYTQAASKAADFILEKLVDKEGRQLRTYRNGEAKLPGYLDDYAYLAEGLLELYSATGEKRWLVEAKRLADAILREFEDKKDGAFFFTADSHENLLMRSKSLMGGGNVPTPNGVAVLVLLELNRITGAKQYETAAERTLEALAGLMWQSTRALDSGIHATAVAVQHRMAKRLKDVPTNDADANQKLGPVTAHLFASNLIAKPGGTLRLALALDIGEGWHLYGPNPNADFLIPTQVKVLPGGSFTAGKIKEPQPRRKLDPILKQILSTYENRIWYFMPITIKDDATEGEVKLIVQVKTQACDQTRCLQPRTDEISLVVKVSTNGSQETRRHPTVFFDVLKAGQ